MSARRPAKKPAGPVAVVGTGPGDPGLLTARALDLLAEAHVVVADADLPGALLERAAPQAERVVLQPGESATAAVTAAARSGRCVVRLVPGDPFLDGATAEVEALVKAKLRVEVVPGVSRATGVPTYAGVPLVGSGRLAERPVLVVPPGTHTDWRELGGSAATLILPLVEPAVVPAVGKVAAALVEHGRAGDTPVSVTVDGASVRQRTVVSTLDAVESDLGAAGLGPTGGTAAVLVVGEVVRLRDRLSWFESRPLFGWTVLVPRTRDQAGELSDLLRESGASPLEVPTIAVEPPRTPAPMERAIRGLVTGRYAWIVFTSTNAVKAVLERLDDVGLDARAFSGVKVAAIGPATAAALAAFGIRADLVPSGEHSSEGLLADFPEHDEVLDPLDRVFLPRADIATETLVAGLKERSWAVDDITAYRTVRAAPPPAPIRESLKGGGVDAVVFTSSSTVRNLLGIAGKPHESTVIACIGPQTAAAATELGLRVDVLAPEATIPALAAALADHALERREQDGGLPPSARARRPKR